MLKLFLTQTIGVGDGEGGRGAIREKIFSGKNRKIREFC